MPTLLTTGLLSLGLCLLLSPLLRFVWLRLDPPPRAEPDRLPAPGVPRVGGVAVLLAATLSLIVPAWLHWSFAGHLNSHLLAQLALPVLLVAVVGMWDDWFNLSPRWKFAGQAAASLLVISQGIRVTSLFHHPVATWLSVVVSVAWLVGCSNAFNLIDGLDGLATGLALFATGTLLAHAVLAGEPDRAVVTGALFAALFGFLAFNFPPASIYLGDAGSLSIGFLLGCLALAWADKATTVVGLVAPVFALLVPLFDTGVAILRRALTGQPLFAGDLSHVHHRLLRRGLSPRGAVLTLYAVAAAGAMASLMLADMRQRHTFELVILLFVVLAVIAVRQLGYTEFAEVGKLVRRGALDPRPAILAQTALRHCAQGLMAAPDYAAAAVCLRELAPALGFCALAFRAGSPAAPVWMEGFATDHQPRPGCWMWRSDLDLPDGLGQVAVWREFELQSPPLAQGTLDDLTILLHQSLVPRLRDWQPPSTARAAHAGSHA